MSRVAPDPETARLECRAFCRYLTGQEPTAYVLDWYRRGWASAVRPGAGADALIERALLWTARQGALPARIADGYARMFQPFSGLRRRLVLTLAILENSPPTAGPLNTAREGTRNGILVSLGMTLVVSGSCLVAGLLLLGPVHLASRLTRRER